MSQGYVTSGRRLYLDKNGKAVDENDPTGVELFASSGSPIPFARAQEVGLIGEDGNLRPELFGMTLHVAPDASTGEENDFGKVPAHQPAKKPKEQK